jgi:hypothetical protein
MSPKPIGLLWDSISNNTGDVAIGMVLKRYCETRNLTYRVVDPFSFNPQDYSTFIIGGGQLLRPSGALFYRNFRIPGPHILNGVGTHLPDHLDYLKDYRLISVRSRAEASAIRTEYPHLPVETRPCISIQFGKYFSSEIEAIRDSSSDDPSLVGIHLNSSAVKKLPEVFSALQILNSRYRLVFLPYTHYEDDRYLSNVLSRLLPGSQVFPSDDPISLYVRIGRIRALVSCSLHASIFAYAQNVPVLAFPQDPKIAHFFQERGFACSLFVSAEDLPGGLDNLLRTEPDYRQAFAQDQDVADLHLGDMETIVRKPLDWSYPDLRNYTDGRYNALHREFYSYAMESHLVASRLNAQSLESELGRKRSEGELLSANRRIGEMKATVESLSAQLAEKERMVQSWREGQGGPDGSLGRRCLRELRRVRAWLRSHRTGPCQR